MTKDFEEKWATHPIAIERYVDFKALDDEDILLRRFTDAMGWTSFLQIRERNYPKLIKAFYFQVETLPDKNLFVSFIKGVKISLTPQVIHKNLGLLADGSSVHGDSWDIDLRLDLVQECQKLFQPNTRGHTSANLEPIPKMLNLLSQHSLIPRRGNQGNVTKNDLMIIHHIFKGKRLSLPHVIIQHMIVAARDTNKKHFLPYGMMLTKIFLKKEVPLDGEALIFEISKFTPKNISHMKTEATQMKDAYAPPMTLTKRKRSESEHEITAPKASSAHSSKHTPERSAEHP